MPKQTSSKKVVSSKGGKRKVSNPVKILAVLVAALVLTVVGTYAYTEWREQDIKAKAGGWKEITNSELKSGYLKQAGIKSIHGCKKYDIVKDANGRPLGDSTAKPGTIYLMITKAKGTKLPYAYIDIYNKKGENEETVLGGVAYPGGKYYWSSADNFLDVVASGKAQIQWWGDEVTVLSSSTDSSRVLTGAKFVLIANKFGGSENGLGRPPHASSYNPSTDKYTYYYWTNRDVNLGSKSSNNGYLIDNVTEYKAALKDWEKHVIFSAAQLPICS